MQKFWQQEPHLIFMDRNMPVKNGVDATRDIRFLQTELGVNPVIVCISDDTSEETRDEFIRAGANGFYHKPFGGNGQITFQEMLEIYCEFVC